MTGAEWKGGARRRVAAHGARARRPARTALLAAALVGAVLAAAGGPLAARAQDPPAPPDDPLLERLAGRWTMRGDVMGDPVTYTLDAEWVLGRQWLRLAMEDVARPPQYEAHAYLGWSEAERRYVAHWLDTFGAAGAGVAGFGSRSGDTLRLAFDYPGGAFFDTFTWEASRRRWTLRLESADSTGARRRFAEYALEPRR